MIAGVRLGIWEAEAKRKKTLRNLQHSPSSARSFDASEYSSPGKFVFRHNNVAHLEELLSRAPPHVPKIVVFESVYSMEGSIAPIKEICNVARRYGALTFCDEVHAVGMYGHQGGGVAQRDGVENQIDIISGTLGKAFGVHGGYIAASSLICDAVRSFGAGLFSSPISPIPSVFDLGSVWVKEEHLLKWMVGWGERL